MSDFDGVVFAGGGCRCFWQAGFYQVAQEALNMQPKAVAAASAGAALGAVSITGLGQRALTNFKKKASTNSQNVYPKNLFSGTAVFPHEALFRGAISETLDQDALAKIRSGPAFWVSLTRLPSDSRFPKLRLFAGISSYLLEGKLRSRIHREWPARLGFEVEWARADTCSSLEELADLLLQTSCTPPFTSALTRDKLPVFDGGLIDNVPVAALSDCNNVLVFLTRPNANLPQRAGVHYVAPSETIPVEKWDYTNPEGLQAAFDLGRKDGDAFVCAQEAAR